MVGNALFVNTSGRLGYVTGATVGLNTLPGLDFDPECSFAFCGICGRVFQSDLDRAQPDGDSPEAMELRTAWRIRHAKGHTERQHYELLMSNRKFTPEAAEKLASFGIIDLDGDDEVNHALLLSKPIPQNDCEGR